MSEIYSLVNSELQSTIEALGWSFALDNMVCKYIDVTQEEEKFIGEEVGVHPMSYPVIDNCNNAHLLYETEKNIVAKAIATHGASRWLTKKMYYVDRKVELISHIYKAHPTTVVKHYLASNDKTKTDEIVTKLASEVFGYLIGRFNKDFLLKGEQLCVKDFIYLDGFNSLKKKYNLNRGSIIEMDENEISFNDLFVESLKDIFGISDMDLFLELPGNNIYDYYKDIKLFFNKHLSQYSQSRRQAPIYWPLQTPSGSYTLWLYYHSLNSQTLYSCVNDFVEPKLALVTEDLNALSNKSNRSSTDEKELTKLTDLQSELKDFRDELLRLAKIWKPNLNDGVQITAAPLWRLFQHTAWQKKLKETWEKLEEGEYDWAHLAASIWPDRVLRKCHQDRSLAIAHDVEDLFWQEVEVPVMRGKKPTGKTKLEWQPIPASETTLNDMVNEAKARLQ